jgi:phosphoglycolate phosphatase
VSCLEPADARRGAAPFARPVVLFDLDGTLSDSARGILGSLRRALADHDLPPFDAATERAVLGPPLYEILPGLIDPNLVPSVVRAYRRHYGDGGMYETDVFPGMHEVLGALSEGGRRLAVATSKPEAYAVPVVEKLGLGDFFPVVAGDDLAGSRPTKASVIGHVLRQLGNPDAAEVVMVGDRMHDVVGARAHGIDCIGVRWGYAAPGELESAGAALIVDRPHDLAAPLGVRP